MTNLNLRTALVFVVLLMTATTAWAQGTIRITLDTKPNSGTNYNFTWTPPIVPPLANFTLDDDANATFNNTILFSAVPVGTYTLTQTTAPAARFIQRSIVCTGDSDNGTVVNLATRRVVIDLDNGENIVCTFSLWRLPDLRIQKRSYLANGTFNFTTTNVDTNLNSVGVQSNATINTITPGVNAIFDANTTTAGTQNPQVQAFDIPVVLTELQNPAFAMLASSPVCTYTGGTLTQSRSILNNGTTAGSFTLSAFAPGDASSTVILCTFYNGPIANLLITVSNGVSTVISGSQTTYTLTATNNGPGVANGAVIRNPIAPGLNCPAGPISCAAAGGAVCPTTPTVAQLQAGVAIPTLPSNGSVVFTLICNVTATGF